MLVLVFSVSLGWTPVSGRGGMVHLILPAITLGTSLAAILTRLMRSSLLEVLNQDYVRTARAKGVSPRSVLFKHALRNGLIAYIMRIVDTIISIPNVMLYLAVLGVFGPSLPTLVLVIGLVNWTTFARVVRGEVLSVRTREFVESAVASGQSTFLIVLRHILPSIVAPIIVVATLNVAVVIVLEASLSFLGLGVQPPTVTWGRMLADGRNYLTTSWWLATFPGIAITILCLSLILVGDWLRDHFDPRTR